METVWLLYWFHKKIRIEFQPLPKNINTICRCTVPLSEAPEALMSRSIPATFVLDPQGNIAIKHIGAANWNSKSVREALDAMLQDAS